MKKGSFTEEYQSMDILSVMLADALKTRSEPLEPDSVTLSQLVDADPLKRSHRRWREIVAEQVKLKAWRKTRKQEGNRIVPSYVQAK